MVKSLGRSAPITKLDIKHAFRLCPVRPADWHLLSIKHAFRLCPVRPADWHLLGTSWEGLYFMELKLPFELRSSVYIFNSFADALEWILKNRYLLESLSHYLDDFFTAGPANTNKCQSSLDIIKLAFQNVGVRLAPEKLEGPCTELTYLGIELDTDEQMLRLPADNYNDPRTLLRQ